MVQIYHGNGKGKTTAACGLAVRASGRGIPVLFGQFLKDASSGEVPMLKKLGIDTLHMSVFYGFVSRMDKRQLAETRQACARMLEETESWIQERLTGMQGSRSDCATEDAGGDGDAEPTADEPNGVDHGSEGANRDSGVEPTADEPGSVDHASVDASNDDGDGRASETADSETDRTPDMPEALVVWDEILHAVRFGLLDEESVIAMLNRYRARVEFVLTGQNPSDAMLAEADYVTEMKCVRHPYEKGIFARKGIEL